VKAGAVIEIEYDVPDDEWYFRENGAATMPFCVFLEAALQPCGWLASFVGSALTTEEDLLFRNLDGKATMQGRGAPDSARSAPW
jgi:3-hydroxymyristoyl/3-hydroxydecanoyl-(acyl carrier protein) dehydratase